MTDDEQKKIFSKNLSYYVSLSGKQQKEIADELNYNQKTFNGWCTGLSMPKAGKIQTLADYFHINKSDLTDEKNLTKLRSKEYEKILDVCNMNYKGALHWSEDMKTEEETCILRNHFSELLLRYKFLMEHYNGMKFRWAKFGDDFSKIYLSKDPNITLEEVKENFIKQELEKDLEDLSHWIESFPNWVARNLREDKEENLIPLAAHERTDIKVTDEMKKHDDDIMDNDDNWS